MRNNGSRYRDDEIISKEPTLIGSFFCGWEDVVRQWANVRVRCHLVN